MPNLRNVTHSRWRETVNPKCSRMFLVPCRTYHETFMKILVGVIRNCADRQQTDQHSRKHNPGRSAEVIISRAHCSCSITPTPITSASAVQMNIQWELCGLYDLVELYHYILMCYWWVCKGWCRMHEIGRHAGRPHDSVTVFKLTRFYWPFSFYATSPTGTW